MRCGRGRCLADSRLGAAIALFSLLCNTACHRFGGILSPRFTEAEPQREYDWNSQSVGAYSLNCVFAATGNKRVWAVGDHGTVLVSEDGEHWGSQTTRTTARLRSVFNAGAGGRTWAVGDGGTILNFSDSQMTWRVQTIGPHDLYAVSGTSDGSHLWAVGDAGTILSSSNGDHWTKVPFQTTDNFRSVIALDNGRRVWIGGEKGILRSGDGGQSWSVVSLERHGSRLFADSNGSHFWSPYSSSVLKSTDGEHWDEVEESAFGWVATAVSGTRDGSDLWAVSIGGEIEESRDYGNVWNERKPAWPANQRPRLLSVFVAAGGGRLWAVGERGAIVLGSVGAIAPFLANAELHSDARTYVDLTVKGGPITSASMSSLNDYDFRRANFTDSNQQVGRPWPKEKPCEHAPMPAQWRCFVDIATTYPIAYGINPVVNLHFNIGLKRGRETDYYLFAAPYRPLAFLTEHPIRTSTVCAVFVLLAIPTALLFINPLANITLYRTLKLNRLEKIDIPGIGTTLQLGLRLVTVLPWFIRKTKTLDAWVSHTNSMVSWSSNDFLEGMIGDRADHRDVYIPLPFRRGDPYSGPQTSQPTASDFLGFTGKFRTTIQIVGPGGAGKTTLARQLCRWALEGGTNGITNHRVIPVWIDEELDSDNSLRAAVRGKLAAAIPNQEIDDVLIDALLEKQRVLICVDRLSERSVETRRHIERIYRSNKVGMLVITSRSVHKLDGAQSVLLFPQPLNSATLLRFMTELLNVLLVGTERVAAFSTIEEQCRLGVRLAALIRFQTTDENREIPLSPLPVRMFVEQAVQLVREGRTLEELPVSLPDIFLFHLRRVNPQELGVEHFIDNDAMVEVTKALAKVALGEDYFPKEFTRKSALNAVRSIGESVAPTRDPISRLKLNGILIEKDAGTVWLRFALDPIAEFMGALAYGDEYGSDTNKWAELLAKAKNAPGFWAALSLVQQARFRNGQFGPPLEVT